MAILICNFSVVLRLQSQWSAKPHFKGDEETTGNWKTSSLNFTSRASPTPPHSTGSADHDLASKVTHFSRLLSAKWDVAGDSAGTMEVLGAPVKLWALGGGQPRGTSALQRSTTQGPNQAPGAGCGKYMERKAGQLPTPFPAFPEPSSSEASFKQEGGASLVAHSVRKSPPSAGDGGSIPGPRRSHMLAGATHVPQLLSPRAWALQQQGCEASHRNEKPAQLSLTPLTMTREEPTCSEKTQHNQINKIIQQQNKREQEGGRLASGMSMLLPHLPMGCHTENRPRQSAGAQYHTKQGGLKPFPSGPSSHSLEPASQQNPDLACIPDRPFSLLIPPCHSELVPKVTVTSPHPCLPGHP